MIRPGDSPRWGCAPCVCSRRWGEPASGRPPGGRGRYRRSHDVFTPCLTGLGERAHLASPTVTLTTHVQDVVNHVLHEDLADIVLLGFSYGGLVVTGSLNEVGERVRHLVYLDAFVPGDGDSLASMMSIPEVWPSRAGEDWLVPPPARSYDDEDEAAFMAGRRVPHPLACFSERVRLARPLEAFPFQRSYIRATADAPEAPGAAAFDAAAKRARDSAAWHCHEIATSHMVASNRPAEPAALLATCCLGGKRSDERDEQREAADRRGDDGAAPDRAQRVGRPCQRVRRFRTGRSRWSASCARSRSSRPMGLRGRRRCSRARCARRDRDHAPAGHPRLAADGDRGARRNAGREPCDAGPGDPYATVRARSSQRAR